MSLDSLAAALAETSLSYWVTDSTWLFGFVESVHVLALTLVYGSIALVDLRLIGLPGPAGGSIEQVLSRLLPFTLGGFVLAAASGSVLFFANPVGYVANNWFAIKFSLMALAGVNALVFHLVFQRKLASGPSLAPRLAGAISLTLWSGILVAGRWIGYTI